MFLTRKCYPTNLLDKSFASVLLSVALIPQTWYSWKVISYECSWVCIGLQSLAHDMRVKKTIHHGHVLLISSLVSGKYIWGKELIKCDHDLTKTRAWINKTCSLINKLWEWILNLWSLYIVVVFFTRMQCAELCINLCIKRITNVNLAWRASKHMMDCVDKFTWLNYFHCTHLFSEKFREILWYPLWY